MDLMWNFAAQGSVDRFIFLVFLRRVDYYIYQVKNHYEASLPSHIIKSVNIYPMMVILPLTWHSYSINNFLWLSRDVQKIETNSSDYDSAPKLGWLRCPPTAEGMCSLGLVSAVDCYTEVERAIFVLLSSTAAFMGITLSQTRATKDLCVRVCFCDAQERQN